MNSQTVLEYPPRSLAPFRLLFSGFAEFLYPKQGSLLIYDPKKQLLAAMKDHCLVAFQFVTNSELSRTLEFFKKKFPSIEQILTIGPPPQNLPLQCLKIENEEWIPYATAIGLALDAAKSDREKSPVSI